MNSSRVAIIGFGPAGIACAIQLKRLGIPFMAFGKGRPGGMLYNANLIENYPGFHHGISGDRLAKLFLEHCWNLEIVPFDEEVTKTEIEGEKFLIRSGGRDFYSDIIVIATGTKALVPAFVSGEALRSGLIHTDLAEVQSVTGIEVCIIGAGDAAFDYALNLAGKGNKAIICLRSGKPRAISLLVTRAEENPWISIRKNWSPVDVSIEENQVTVNFNTPSGPVSCQAARLLVATGRKPALDYLGPGITGNIDELKRHGRLYFAGDVINGACRQVAVAIGDGVRTAMEIYENGSRL